MKAISDFDIKLVPLHSIAYATTNSDGYEEGRVLVSENWPEYGDYTVIHGSHCSCYGFDDTAFDAQVYSYDEFVLLMKSWYTETYNYYGESSIAHLVLKNLGEPGY